MALPVNGSTHLIPALLLICRPRKDERLSWPSWLTCSGWLTHISCHPSAAGRAQDRESSLVRDRRSTTVPRHQLRQRRNDRVSFASPSCRLLAMQSRVYETVRCLSVCLPPARRAHSSKPAAVGMLLWARRRAGDIDRLLQQRRANAGSGTLSACVGS